MFLDHLYRSGSTDAGTIEVFLFLCFARANLFVRAKSRRGDGTF